MVWLKLHVKPVSKEKDRKVFTAGVDSNDAKLIWLFIFYDFISRKAADL